MMQEAKRRKLLFRSFCLIPLDSFLAGFGIRLLFVGEDREDLSLTIATVSGSALSLYAAIAFFLKAKEVRGWKIWERADG